MQNRPYPYCYWLAPLYIEAWHLQWRITTQICGDDEMFHHSIHPSMILLYASKITSSIGSGCPPMAALSKWCNSFLSFFSTPWLYPNAPKCSCLVQHSTASSRRLPPPIWHIAMGSFSSILFNRIISISLLLCGRRWRSKIHWWHGRIRGGTMGLDENMKTKYCQRGRQWQML